MLLNPNGSYLKFPSTKESINTYRHLKRLTRDQYQMWVCVLSLNSLGKTNQRPCDLWHGLHVPRAKNLKKATMHSPLKWLDNIYLLALVST